MIDIRQTDSFRNWLGDLKDGIAVKAVKRRIARVQIGLFGDCKALGGGLHELRVDHGPGYRVYFLRQGSILVILLCGGDKSTQSRDIDRARALASKWNENDVP